jgi:hypothetical protein
VLLALHYSIGLETGVIIICKFLPAKVYFYDKNSLTPLPETYKQTIRQKKPVDERASNEYEDDSSVFKNEEVTSAFKVNLTSLTIYFYSTFLHRCKYCDCLTPPTCSPRFLSHS